LFFFIIFDLFVYGKTGKKAPYSLKILTQIQLSQLLVLETKQKNSIILKSLGILIFSDATHE